MSATMQNHLASETNKALGSILEQVDIIRDTIPLIDTEKMVETGGERLAVEFLQSLQNSAQTLGIVTLAIVAGQAMSQGEELN